MRGAPSVRLLDPRTGGARAGRSLHGIPPVPARPPGARAQYLTAIPRRTPPATPARHRGFALRARLGRMASHHDHESPPCQSFHSPPFPTTESGSSPPPARSARAPGALAAVDGWLSQWSAHGEPLTWPATGVTTTSSPSALTVSRRDLWLFGRCAVRVLQQQQGAIGVAGGWRRIFFRDPAGAIQCVDRDAFARLLSVGAVGDATPVFDTTITSLTAYRSAFERPCAESWHRDLALPAASSASQPIIVR